MYLWANVDEGCSCLPWYFLMLIAGRTFFTNVPAVKDQGISLWKLCQKLHIGSQRPYDPLAFDLLKKCLALIPAERITATEALHHPFLVK